MTGRVSSFNSTCYCYYVVYRKGTKTTSDRTAIVRCCSTSTAGGGEHVHIDFTGGETSDGHIYDFIPDFDYETHQAVAQQVEVHDPCHKSNSLIDAINYLSHYMIQYLVINLGLYKTEFVALKFKLMQLLVVFFTIRLFTL